MYIYYGLIEELPQPVAVGSFYDKPRRRIPIEQLREILKEQGSPWADELADTYRVAEKSLATPKSKKHKRITENILEEIPERIADPVDWGPVVLSLQAAEKATRATSAIKHAEAALSAIRTARADEDDDEAMMLILRIFH